MYTFTGRDSEIIVQSLGCGSRPPPLTARKRTAVGCSTDGEELKNSQIFSVVYSSVAVLFRAIKGMPLMRWLGFPPQA